MKNQLNIWRVNNNQKTSTRNQYIKVTLITKKQALGVTKDAIELTKSNKIRG